MAEAPLPVPGLGFTDGGVTLNGVPFEQASAAEQLRVSVGIGMALNPKLRVLRIADGSLLDKDNLALLEDLAAANDFQVWIERVEPGTRAAITIEDGHVAGQVAEPARDFERGYRPQGPAVKPQDLKPPKGGSAIQPPSQVKS